MPFRIRFRFDGKCTRHPRYNPKSDGRPPDGKCEGCESLYVIHLYTRIAKRRAENANLIVVRASTDRRELDAIDARSALKRELNHELCTNNPAFFRRPPCRNAGCSRLVGASQQIASGIPLAPSSWRLGRSLPGRQDRERVELETWLPDDEQLSSARCRKAVGHHRGRSFRDYPVAANRILKSFSGVSGCRFASRKPYARFATVRAKCLPTRGRRGRRNWRLRTLADKRFHSVRAKSATDNVAPGSRRASINSWNKTPSSVRRRCKVRLLKRNSRATCSIPGRSNSDVLQSFTRLSVVPGGVKSLKCKCCHLSG